MMQVMLAVSTWGPKAAVVPVACFVSRGTRVVSCFKIKDRMANQATSPFLRSKSTKMICFQVVESPPD